MQESAIVKKVAGQTATLVIDKKDECSKCGMCLFPKGANAIEFEAENSVNAKVGDTVLIERSFMFHMICFLPKFQDIPQCFFDKVN